MKYQPKRLVIWFVATSSLCCAAVLLAQRPGPPADMHPPFRAAGPVRVHPPRGHDPRVARTMQQYRQFEERLRELVRSYHGTDDAKRRGEIRDRIVEITLEQFRPKHAMRGQESERLSEQMEAIAPNYYVP